MLLSFICLWKSSCSSKEPEFESENFNNDMQEWKKFKKESLKKEEVNLSKKSSRQK